MKNASFEGFQQIVGFLKTIEPTLLSKIYFKNINLIKNSLKIERKWFSIEEIEQFYNETFSTKSLFNKNIFFNEYFYKFYFNLIFSSIFLINFIFVDHMRKRTVFSKHFFKRPKYCSFG